MFEVRKSARVGAILAVACGAIAILAWWWDRNHRELAIAGVVEVQEINVGSKVGGRVSEVAVHEGDEVDAGALLLRFEAPELLARRDQLAAVLAQAEANLERWQNGALPEEVEVAQATHAAAAARYAMLQEWTRPEEMQQGEAELDAAKADRAVADSSWKRVAELHAGRVASAQQLDDARAAKDAAGARLRAAEARIALLEAGARAEEITRAREEARAARAQLDLLRSGTRPELLAEARGRRDEARAALAEADAQLRECEVRAPGCGKVRVEVVSVRAGDLIPPGKPVIRLLDSRDLWVKAYCPEPDLSRFRIGDRASVRIDSAPGRAFPGAITHVAGESEYTPRNIQSLDERWNQVFAVKVKVDAPAGMLKPGMAAIVTLAQEK